MKIFLQVCLLSVACYAGIDQETQTESDAHLPVETRCRLTGRIMTDPVIASDGYTYERAAILQWMQNFDYSPVTREALFGGIRPNFLVRQLILAYQTNLESSEIDCPILMQPMREPVVASDGYTYEKAAIERVIDQSKRQSSKPPASPMTRQDLYEGLWSNRVLPAFIDGVIGRVGPPPAPPPIVKQVLPRRPFPMVHSLKGIESVLRSFKGTLTEKDAQLLVRAAMRDNEKSSFLCWPGHKGSDRLRHIFTFNFDRFDTSALIAIRAWLNPSAGGLEEPFVFPPPLPGHEHL